MSCHGPRFCAIVPFINNHRTVAQVVDKVRAHLPDVIAVDDGSTDGSADTLEPFPGLALLAHEVNRGKGAAVKTGAAEARARGFSHVLQIDADDQHDADDIPRFLEAARERPEAVFAGERIFDEHVPGSSRFGRRFGVFWYRLETGFHPLADTQCGFRVYPLALFDRVRVGGDRMDFDAEVLVRAVWAGLPVIGVATRVRYFPEEERVSHFRPCLDNVLFSSLHCRLTILNGLRLLLWPLSKVAGLLRPKTAG